MKLVKISEMQRIPYNDRGESLVRFSNILVRQSVADKLTQIQKKLKGLQLQIVEGYRSPQVQERLYLKELLARNNPAISFEDLIEQAHQLIALPSVAGHPTGGAVDVTFQGIDMGGGVKDFSLPERLPTYSTLATPEQAHYRKLLHDLMTSVGFAPFYGEWWHFSYGDLEWAAFYNQPEALYAPLYLGGSL